MQELNDKDLEGVTGGSFSFSSFPNSSSAGTDVSATASGQHAASTQAQSQSITIGLPINGAPSASFSLGIAAGYGF
jgi:hypothetical protein